MTDVERRYHEKWLGLVQPADGLVVSSVVLTDAEVMARRGSDLRERFAEICDESGAFVLRRAVEAVLELPRERIDDAPNASVYLPEGSETVKPTFAITSANGAAMILAWESPGVDLDKPDTRVGAWAYPLVAKMERLLRATGVAIGLLSNRDEARLVYAPPDEAVGWIAFRKDALASSGGEVLDAFVALLGKARLFGSAPDRTLLALLKKSRESQANVTDALAEQVFEALQILLRGFEDAAARDKSPLLREAVEAGTVYPALLTVLLRVVLVLYAEQRSMLPVSSELYEQELGLGALHKHLRDDATAHIDTMSERFSAWPRLVALFRAIYFGAHAGDFALPARRGELFDPAEHPFLEGWGPSGGAPITEDDRRAVRVPTVGDDVVLAVLDRLLVLGGQRLSYSALDVEQIGSVYERLMGYAATRMETTSVCLRDDTRRTHGFWIACDAVLAEPPKKRGALLEEYAGKKLGKAVPLIETARTESEMLAALAPLVKRNTEVVKNRLVLQPSLERRRTSSHYTPRFFTEPIVEKTLAPLLAVMGEHPTSEQLLALKVCDPAMGSGAFLVAATRYLGKALERAWAREGVVHPDAEKRAQRVVAQRCIYGVDKNPLAVSLAKLSLWLTTFAKDEPFTFLDHALRHGDTLVGLSLEQIGAFDWDPPKKPKTGQLDLFGREIEVELGESVARRQEILAAAETATSTADKERLAFYAKDGLDRVQLIGDLIVGAFFEKDKDKDRKKELANRRARVEAWLRSGEHVPDDLRAMQRAICARVPVLHWPVEFPEVFFAERPDPLEGGAKNRVAMMDAFVGNPPFAGKNGVGAIDVAYLPWLQTIHEGAHGNADLSAHFFRRASALLGKHGTIGLIATNTIAQGDTRATGLQHLVNEEDCVIYDAVKSMAWPTGDANVSVSVVHLAKGAAKRVVDECTLDGRRVETIDSRLRPKPERPDPVALSENADLSFQGSIVLGMGFTLTPAERDALVAKDPRNDERIFPYLGGEEVNTSPTQAFDRYVINFGQMTLDEARRWPDLLEIVEMKVKPERDKQNRDIRKKYWWRFGEVAPALYAAIAPLERCLVTAVYTKHLCLSFQPTGRVFNNKLYVFPFDCFAPFAILQSRTHTPWAWLTSSTLRFDLAYAPSDSFETFPFPERDPRAVISTVEDIGQELYDARAAFMIATQQGLTKTYNALKDPDCADVRILELRRLHEAMDRAVLDAYTWTDIEVPPYCPASDDDRAAVAAFEDEVIDRLFALNAKRAGKSAPPKPRQS